MIHRTYFPAGASSSETLGDKDEKGHTYLFAE